MCWLKKYLRVWKCWEEGKKIPPLKTPWGELSPVGEIGEFEHGSCVFCWLQISCAESKPWCIEINQYDRKPGQLFSLAKNDIKMPFCVLSCNLIGVAKIVVETALHSPCKNWLCVPSWDLEASTPGSNICESNLLLGLINYFLQRTYGGMVMMMMKMTKMTKRKTKMASLTGWQASVSSSVNSGTKIKMGNWMLMKSRSGSFLKIMTIAQPRPNTWLRLLMLIRFVVCAVWKLQSASFENDLNLLLSMFCFFGSDKLSWFLSLFCPELVDMICSQICELPVHSYFWTTPECHWTSRTPLPL